jgi:hypothetical protein
MGSHLLYHCVAELGALHFLRAFHQAGEVVGDGLGVDGAVHAFDDEVGGFGPAHVAQHHLAAEHDAAGLTLSWLAYLGAVPWVASKMAWPVM